MIQGMENAVRAASLAAAADPDKKPGCKDRCRKCCICLIKVIKVLVSMIAGTIFWCVGLLVDQILEFVHPNMDTWIILQTFLLSLLMQWFVVYFPKTFVVYGLKWAFFQWRFNRKQGKKCCGRGGRSSKVADESDAKAKELTPEEKAAKKKKCNELAAKYKKPKANDADAAADKGGEEKPADSSGGAEQPADSTGSTDEGS